MFKKITSVVDNIKAKSAEVLEARIEDMKNLYVDAKSLNALIEQKLLYDFSKNAGNAEEKSEHPDFAEFEFEIDITPYLVKTIRHEDFVKIKNLGELARLRKLVEAKFIANSRAWNYSAQVYQEAGVNTEYRVMMKINCHKINGMAAMAIRSYSHLDFENCI